MQLRDGSSVVSSAPGIICYTDEHNTLMGVAVLALIVYVVGLPAVTLGTTTYARYKDKLRDPIWLDTIGLFYREYGALPIRVALFVRSPPRRTYVAVTRSLRRARCNRRDGCPSVATAASSSS
jgi:hypothetical protein